MAGEPKIFGTPVTTCVYGVCLIHLLICVLILSYLVVGHPHDMEGIIVSPVLQWVYGTFTMISITVIVCAGVGALYAIESHLNIYGMLLLVSVLLDIFLFVVFLLWGRSCSTKNSDSPYHLVATLSCGLRDGMLLFCLTLLIVFKLVGVWIVNKCRRYVSSATNQDLMPFLRKHLQTQMVEEDFQEPEPMPMTWMPTMQQPANMKWVMSPTPLNANSVPVGGAMMPSMGPVSRPVATMMPMGPVASMGPMVPMGPMAGMGPAGSFVGPASQGPTPPTGSFVGPVGTQPTVGLGQTVPGYGSLDALNAS